MQGILVPMVPGFWTASVMLYDLDEKQEQLGVLPLGDDVDIYVMYDPFCGGTSGMTGAFALMGGAFAYKHRSRFRMTKEQ